MAFTEVCNYLNQIDQPPINAMLQTILDCKLLGREPNKGSVLIIGFMFIKTFSVQRHTPSETLEDLDRFTKRPFIESSQMQHSQNRKDEQ